MRTISRSKIPRKYDFCIYKMEYHKADYTQKFIRVCEKIKMKISTIYKNSLVVKVQFFKRRRIYRRKVLALNTLRLVQNMLTNNLVHFVYVICAFTKLFNNRILLVFDPNF